MTMTIDAVYEAGVFRPLAPMELSEGEQVKLTVNSNLLAEMELAELERNAPDPGRAFEIMTEIAAMPMETGGQEFAGIDHDKILYGGPEGAR
jgi:predicted DNA-binding antitoxin AbrB/MazE fold protein